MSDIGTNQNAEDFLQMTEAERIEFAQLMQKNAAFAELMNEARTATSGQIKIAAAFLNECKKRRGTA